MTYDLAKWATEARKAAGMTQEDFALELGFSTKASVNAIEKGRNKPTFETMVKISEISGFPLPYQETFPKKYCLKIQTAFLTTAYALSGWTWLPRLETATSTTKQWRWSISFMSIKNGRAKNSAATSPVSKSSRHAAIPCKALSRTETCCLSIPPSTHSKERAFTSYPSQTA